MNEETVKVVNMTYESDEIITELSVNAPPSADEIELLEKIRNDEITIIDTKQFNSLIEHHKFFKEDNAQMRVDLLDAYKIITNILKIIQVRGIGLLFSIVDKKMIYTALKRMVAKESDKPLFNEEQSKKIGENFISAVNNDDNVKKYVPRIQQLIQKYAPMFSGKKQLQ